MTVVHRRFLPDRLRPRAPRNRSHRRFLVPVLVLMAGLLALPLWTVRSVEVRGGEVVPETVTTSLEGLIGHVVPILELDWLHWVAAAWPAASEVRVHLELPGTLVVEIFPQTPRGSVPVGSGWHAVAADGRLAGSLEEPRFPHLVGFRRPSDRRLAFVVARRMAQASGGEVVAVRHVTPADYGVDLRFSEGRTVSVHVIPEGTAAETAWCELVANGGLMVEWADLRWRHRMVLRAGAMEEVRDPRLAPVLRGAA